MNTLGFYDNYIQNHFVKQDCGIDLKLIGKITEEIYFPVKSITQLPYKSLAINKYRKYVPFYSGKTDIDRWNFVFLQ